MILKNYLKDIVIMLRKYKKNVFEIKNQNTISKWCTRILLNANQSNTKFWNSKSWISTFLEDFPGSSDTCIPKNSSNLLSGWELLCPSADFAMLVYQNFAGPSYSHDLHKLVQFHVSFQSWHSVTLHS